MKRDIFTFQDYYSNNVSLSFEMKPFSKSPRHVWVICRHKDKWLMTQHESRGIEFPGGKVEFGESQEAAAIREVFEETGGRVGSIKYLGQYKVDSKKEVIIKNVYFASVDTLEQQAHYFETNGPILLKEIPDDIKTNPSFSFIMKDEVLTHCLKRIKEI